MLCFKVEMHVSVPAEQTFHLLSDLTRRKEWDRHYELATSAQQHTALSSLLQKVNSIEEERINESFVFGVFTAQT